jgi:hypothetical protein
VLRSDSHVHVQHVHMTHDMYMHMYMHMYTDMYMRVQRAPVWTPVRATALVPGLCMFGFTRSYDLSTAKSKDNLSSRVCACWCASVHQGLWWPLHRSEGPTVTDRQT